MHLANYIKNRLPYWPNWLNRILLKLNIFGPLVYGRGYMKYAQSLSSFNAEKSLLDMVNYAIECVPYYRKRYEGIKIQSIEEFEQKIHFIDKDEVMAHWDEFISDDIDWKKCSVGTTGGTSGKPLKLVTPNNRYSREMYFFHKGLKCYGWNYDVKAVIRNHHLPENRDYIINPIMKEVIFDPFRMNSDYAFRVWRIMSRMRIRFLYAYPSAAYQFLRFCTHQGLDTSFIKGAFLASEGVSENQRALIEGKLHIPIYSFFGHSEKLIYAGSSPDASDYVVEEEYGYLELADEGGTLVKKVGEQGEMVGTTLFNKWFPLIRYRTGDFSSYSSLESGKRKLRGVLGRWQNNLIFKDKNTYVPITALNMHGEINEHIDGMQYIQSKIGELEILIIKNEMYSDKDEEYLRAHHEAAFGGSVKITYVDKLKTQPNGKFLPLISQVTR